ncbi:polymorphic toxin-type HINT domain-containing protein [Psychrobacter sp. 5A.1]|uniref:Hint domain-containing protein n=1 Tax=Psychrobacter sp. 5A.1 TaxID=3035207 RepID=UPI0025B6184B|nr:Hint domain-containing protein [Psychrobacter sp. 5A.1]MDN3503494.1 polymorphic toxin-type HINT domain-containing protein [Psychrobacter sp. 5A.1]
MNNKGFVAGTLVHTDKGLVPIQELKIGDKVLSKDESGKGELVYKPVLRTIKSATKQKIMTSVNGIYCTENHPFFTHVYGEDKPRWLAAEFITSNDTVHHIFPEKGLGGGIYDIDGRYLTPAVKSVYINLGDFSYAA